MKSIILATIAIYLSSGVLALETSLESRRTIAKSQSHMRLRRSPVEDTEQRGVPPAVLANVAMTFMKGSAKTRKAEPVQLNPGKSTYTWKGDHYEQIPSYGL